MQLTSKLNKGFRFLLCVIDIYSKYAWLVPLKDKKGVSIVNAFQEILHDSKRKPNKIRKRKLLITIMINTLLLQILIL